MEESVYQNEIMGTRIENNTSDISLSTLMKIIQKGFGGELRLELQL